MRPVCVYVHLQPQIQTSCSIVWIYLMLNILSFFQLQIKFSVMQPGTHVWPHTGPTNCRLRMHLGLVIPPRGCRIRCTNQTRSVTSKPARRNKKIKHKFQCELLVQQKYKRSMHSVHFAPFSNIHWQTCPCVLQRVGRGKGVDIWWFVWARSVAGCRQL